MSKRLLYFCPGARGGIVDYAHAQATALAGRGVDVTMLCGSDWPFGEATKYRQLRQLPASSTRRVTMRIHSRVRTATNILTNFWRLRRVIRTGGHQRVLLASYFEYLAPLWAPQLRALNRQGVIFGAVVHDPVRNYIVGPVWWHRFSVCEGYSFLREAFVHSSVDLGLDASKLLPRTTVIPHGPFEFGDPTRSGREMRDELSLPQDATVLLSFGHIRAGKNLDLVLRAMVDVEKVFLVVAGSEGGPGQVSARQYRQLALDLGVSSRCRWTIEYLNASEVANLFACVDFVVLTYSQHFRSASGVLNIAARYRKRVLASGGESALCEVVKRYNLGITIESDSSSAISKGITELINSGQDPDWISYLRDHSWDTNAYRVATAMDCLGESDIFSSDHGVRPIA